MQPDPLVAAWAAIKTVVWFMFGAPQMLWNKTTLYCPFGSGRCEPFSPIIAAGIACIILICALWNILLALLSWRDLRTVTVHLVFATLFLSVNAALPPLYDGLQTLIIRSGQRDRERERQERTGERRRDEIRAQEIQQQRRDYLNGQSR